MHRTMIGAEAEKACCHRVSFKVFQSFYVALNSVQKSQQTV